MKNGDELEITIDANGQVQVITHGVKGTRCLEYMELFRTLLGPVSDKELTAEYNEIETNAQTQVHVQQHVGRGGKIEL